MVWFIVCLGVIIAGFILWDSIHDELPEVLQLPRSAQPVIMDEPGGASAQAVGPGKWKVQTDLQNLRVSREFNDQIVAGETRYYPPVMHLSCYNGQLYAWVNTGLMPAEDPRFPGTVSVSVNGQAPERWMKGEGAMIVSTQPAQLVAALSSNDSLSLELAFTEAPKQSLRLSTDGFERIKPRLQSCAPAPTGAAR